MKIIEELYKQYLQNKKTNKSKWYRYKISASITTTKRIVQNRKETK